MKNYVLLVVLLVICTFVFSQKSNAKFEKPEDKEWNQLKDLFSIVSVGGARFHPNKDEMIFVSDRPGVLQIYTVPYDRKLGRSIGKPKRFINTKNRVSSPRYLHNGNILYLHDRGGDENYQIGLYRVKERKTFWLTNDHSARHLVNMVTKNYMYFTSNSRNKKKFELYRRKRPLLDHTEIEHIYTPTTGVVHLSLVNRNETKFVLNHHYSNLNSELVYYDMNDKSVTSLTKPLSGNKPTRWIALKWLNRKRNKMLVKTDYKSNFLRVAILYWPSGDVKIGKPKFIRIPFMESLKSDVISIAKNAATGYYYIEINEQGYSKIIRAIYLDGDFYDAKRIKLPLKKAVIAHGDSRSFGRGWTISRDGEFMALTITNANTPRNIYMMRLSTRTRDPVQAWPLLSESLTPPSLQKAKFVSEKLHFYKSFDGLKVPYFLYIPKGKMPKGGWPAIIKLHGGPESQSRPAFSPLTQFLLGAGFAIAEPNIRGSRGYGKKYLNMDNQHKRMDAIKDIKYLALHLKKKSHFINGKRLVVMGGSYGGYATLMAVVNFPKLWKAGVDVVGMSNLVTFLQSTSKWRRKLREPEYGSLKKQRKMLERLSPINYVHRTRCPVFIIQGDNDPRVPVGEAIQMYKKLQEIGKKHPAVAKSQLLRFPDEGHGFSKKINRLKAYKALSKWLKEIV
jgi:protease II